MEAQTSQLCLWQPGSHAVCIYDLLEGAPFHSLSRLEILQAERVVLCSTALLGLGKHAGAQRQVQPAAQAHESLQAGSYLHNLAQHVTCELWCGQYRPDGWSSVGQAEMQFATAQYSRIPDLVMEHACVERPCPWPCCCWLAGG